MNHIGNNLLARALETNSKEYFDKSFERVKAIEYAEKCHRAALKGLRQEKIKELKEAFEYWKYLKMKS